MTSTAPSSTRPVGRRSRPAVRPPGRSRRHRSHRSPTDPAHRRAGGGPHRLPADPHLGAAAMEPFVLSRDGVGCSLEHRGRKMRCDEPSPPASGCSSAWRGCGTPASPGRPGWSSGWGNSTCVGRSRTRRSARASNRPTGLGLQATGVLERVLPSVRTTQRPPGHR